MLKLVEEVTIKEQALEKLLKEMEKAHSHEIDIIHNWICDQEDDVLFEGIMQEGKTLSKAYEECSKKAQRKASGKKSIAIDGHTILSWVYSYFTGKKTKITMDGPPKTSPVKKVSKKRKNQDNGDTEQMNLFDSL